MKTAAILFIVLLCFIGNKINAQNYGLDNTDPAVFTKFRIPETDLKSLWFNTNLHFNSNKSISSSEQPFYNYSNNSYNSSFNYTLNPQYLFLRESEDMYLNIHGNVNATYTHNYSSYESSGINVPDKSEENDYSSLINLGSTYNKYVNSGGIFYSAGADLLVQLNESKTEIISSSSSGNYNNYKTQIYSISAGIGKGKLRDVTPVVTAVRFQERMKQLGVISRDFSDNTIEDLAMQFYKQPYYSDVHSRADKYFWQGIDNVLASDGISLKELNMYADSYLKEAVNEVRFFRQEGLIAGVNLQLRYNNYYNYPSGISEGLFLMTDPYLEYSHQLNLNSQINLSISLNGGYNLKKNNNEKQQYAIAANIGYDYELTDRLVASIRNNLEFDIHNRDVQEKVLFDYLNFNLTYFVEDNFQLNTTYRWYYSYTRFSELKNEALNNSLDIGFTYYIDRGFLFN